VPATRGLGKAVVAPYVVPSVYNRFYRETGYEQAAQAVLHAAGDRQAMTAAISDRVIDEADPATDVGGALPPTSDRPLGGSISALPALGS
jgi:hypothetical protein